MSRKQKFSIVAASLILVSGLMGALELVGEKATLAKLLIIYFGGVGGGAGLISAIRYKSK